MPAVYGAICAAIVGVVLIVVLTVGADWFPFSYVVFHGFLLIQYRFVSILVILKKKTVVFF